MLYVWIGGIRQPLQAEAWNPRYRAGIRHCALLLANEHYRSAGSTYEHEGEPFHIESDMWKIAEAILQMSIPDRVTHGWTDFGWVPSQFDR